MKVPDELDDTRVDRAVATLFALPTATARALCEQGRVRVNGRKQRKGDRVKAGAVVDVEAPDWFVAGAPAAVILRETRDVVVVDKPAGVPCHPLVPGEGGTVADAVVAAFPEVKSAGLEEREAGLLHRLDTGTSGCLAFARSRAVWLDLRQAFDLVDKTYLAIVQGSCAAAVVDDPIGHDPSDPKRMRVDPAGRAAKTVVTPLSSSSQASLVKLALHGGRRHQLRVHLAQLGHPLVGDALYALSSPLPSSGEGAGVRGLSSTSGFHLHAWKLGLPSVDVVEAPLPPAFLAALAAFGLSKP
ncbi:MAG: RluA family pseudouridine synthase [Deltaproteobacteria bacterium]|nr:RluA family pseudouridine synthase [Deltaproteobacteria bacterium]